MSGITLDVYRDRYDSYQLVGHLSLNEEGGESASFRYSERYLNALDARAISVALPLTSKPYNGTRVKAWFGALVPEGRAAWELSQQYGLDADDYVRMITHLSDETIGCLVFAVPGVIPGLHEAYTELDSSFLESFAASPIRVARQTLGRARLSLAGEMSKVGLYQDMRTGIWFLPSGTAPSTHIVKACSGEYPGQTINEGLCMKAAELCGLETPETYLMDCGGAEPLIVSRRFDRMLEESERLVDGMTRPRRLHQEDFCQALGVTTTFKYEPTGADFLRNMAHCITESCSDAFGDRVVLLESIAFSYLVGNCDNHLKNYSMLYDKSMTGCVVSPTYDVTSTTYYPDLSREMGVALSASRKIDDVRRADLEDACKRSGVAHQIGMDVIDRLRQRVLGAMEEARDYYIAQGFLDARAVADRLLRDIVGRIDATRP